LPVASALNPPSPGVWLAPSRARVATAGFWTGRHVIGDLSVCYRSAWESARPGERLMTFTPENPNSVNPDWPFRGIDHVLIRCGDSGGPSREPAR
jgi:hypothetical protein